MIIKALKELGITSDFAVDADVKTEEHYKRTFKDISGENRFIEWSILKEKMDELQKAEPMRLLRKERNQKLEETDWWCCSDRTPNQAQLDYRTSLRNLPSTASPSLDENGNLTGVNWPEKPQN